MLGVFGAIHCALAAVSEPVLAAGLEPGTDEPAPQLPAITVVASPEASDSVKDVGSVSELPRTELTRSGKRELNEVLTGRAGVHSVRSSSRGTLTTLFVRGISSGLGLVTVDDIPLYSSGSEFFNLSPLVAEALERVEVVRGPFAPRYGSQALGRLVRLFTRESDHTGAGLRVEGGSFGSWNTTASGSLARAAGSLTATLSRDEVLEGTNQADPRNGNTELDTYHSTLATLRLGAAPAARLSLDGTLLDSRSFAENDGPGVLPDGRLGVVDDPGAIDQEEAWLAQGTAVVTPAPDWRSSLKLGFTQNQGAAKAFGTKLGFTQRLWLGRWRNTHELVSSERRDRSLRLTWGGEGRYEDSGSAGPGPALDGRRSTVIGSVELEFTERPLSGVIGVQGNHYSDFGTHPTFFLGLGWQALPMIKLHASTGWGYRPPGLQERFVPFLGNPDLAEEEGLSSDIGFDWQLRPDMLLSVTGYYGRYEGLIVPVFRPELALFVPENVRRARLQGIEAEWRYAIHDGINLGADYTYASSRDLDTGTVLPAPPSPPGQGLR